MLARALADDVHPAFVRLVLAEGALAAADALTRLWPADLDAQLEILRAHAGALWSGAPDALLAALARMPPGPRAEQLAALLRGTPGERDALARLARAALADTTEPLPRARALLALARADGDRERIAAAMPLLADLKIWDLARVAHDFSDMFDGPQRAEVRALALRSPRREWSSEVALALARAAPADEARADALSVIERMRDGEVLLSPWKLPALVPVLSWDELRRWVDPHLRRARGLWDASSTVPAWVSLAAPDQLDAMVEMIVRGASYPWDRVRLLALVSRHHPTRAEELLARAREGLLPLIQAPGSGRGANPAPVGGGRAATVHQVHALVGVAAASAGEERVALQRQALAHLATDAAHYDERETISPYHWPAVGERIDPSLHEACVDVLLAFADRYTCWGAIGGVVACFPAGARGLASRALVRVGDSAPAELVERTRAALDDAPRSAAQAPYEPPPDPLADDRVDADAASLAAVLAGARSHEDFWRLVRAYAPALLRAAGPGALALLRSRLVEGLPPLAKT